MRMWAINPKLMCRKHLLGEHAEMHMFSGSIRKGIRFDGYVAKGLVEVDHIKRRHDELAKEMIVRGFQHKTPIYREEFTPYATGLTRDDMNHIFGKVDSLTSIIELSNRCEECRKRINGSDD